MTIAVHSCVPQPPRTGLAIVCPGCRRQGTLDIFANTVDGYSAPTESQFGFRRCANPECHKLIFIIVQHDRIVTAFPPSKLDFDTTNIPSAVTDAMEEAVTCHSTACYVASAIMVRKTLEELCRDRGATGKDLKERLRALKEKVVLPIELLEGSDDLRLLGNDAAHVESQEFNKVGKEEVEIGIEFAKEVLKAVYQYSDLLNRMRALKKSN